jgi:two-component system sensor histidine kinase KdpD
MKMSQRQQTRGDPSGALATGSIGHVIGFRHFSADGAFARRRLVVAVGLGLAALAIAYWAHLNGRPVTAALVAVLGAVTVGALLGLRAGVVAGLAASVTYNLLFTDPVLKFSVNSADDLVPVIALNLSAIAAGLIAGRLHDRAVAAETSTRRVAELLQFSQDLQRAVTLAEVERVAQDHFGREELSAQLFVETAAKLRSPSVQGWGGDTARHVWENRMACLGCGNQTGYLLKSADRMLGVLVLAGDRPYAAQDVLVFLPLLNLAIVRCQLAEQLSDADVLRRSEKFKTILLSSVSHDLRTPLAAISASASSLAGLGDKLGEDVKADLLNMIQEQCERLDRLTANLLNLGRIEAGLDVERMPVVDAIEVLGGTLSRIRRLNSARDIERDLAASSALVRADEALLEQVFLNVLENAVTHTPANTPIKVSADTSAGSLMIAVEDNGPGVPKAERSRVFDRFYQGRPRRAPGGSGLGLSIAKGFTELIGGTITAGAATAPLRGARIEVILPLTGVAAK